MITGRFFAAGADRRIAITIFILLAVAVLVPLLNLAVSPTSAFYVPSYIVALTGKYLC
ncbi:urea ABC transporter permease subunit UrtC, partial [Mesorhizobium sp. M7A.F.Ca.CA.004.12.1.1]